MNNSPQKHPIGTQYYTRGKNPRLCTITDFMTVTNSKGEIIKTYYQSQHEFMGQIITYHEVPHASVAMGIK